MNPINIYFIPHILQRQPYSKDNFLIRKTMGKKNVKIGDIRRSLNLS